MHLDIIKVFHLPTDAQEFCFKRDVKIYIKNVLTCFGLTFKNLASYIYDRHTATLQMLHFIYIFSANISTEYFKHAAHSPFFSSKCHLFHNANIFGSCIIQILHTGCAKI
jgi:hypothetical protein